MSAESCGCIDRANDALREHNTRISRELAINDKTSTMTLMLMVPTEKISRKVRKPVMKLAANFCPLCGVKL